LIANSSLFRKVGSECWIVFDIIDTDLQLETSMRVFQLVKMEGLGLVEFVSVCSPKLVCVLVLLSPPCGTVP
jgi:hypothetical protein